LDGADFTLFKQNAEGVFEAVDTKVVEPSESDNTVNGPVFSFYGLDDGIYKLEETNVPDGYKGIDPMIFEVTAEHVINSADPELEDLSAMIYDLENKKATTDEFGNVNVADGLITADVANTKVSKLPETGGMGTKLFVIGGGLTAGAAGIYLITKKRTKDAE
jgi:LPXTG-motif cell wall-anchored protein